MKNINDNRVTVRLDEEAAANLENLIEKTGLNKSQIINDLLKHGDKLWIHDGRELATELQYLRLTLKKGIFDDMTKRLLTNISERIHETLYKMFESYAAQEEEDGDIQRC